MACISCLCNNTINNTGTLCTIVQKVTRKLFAVPLFADDGTPNQILYTDTLNQAYLTAKINHIDPSKRWYPIPNVLNVESVRPDSIFETFNNQVKQKVQISPKPFVGYITPEAGQGASSPQEIANLSSLACVDFGVFAVDVEQNFGGYENADHAGLLPLPVNSGSLDVIQVDPTDTTVNKIKLSFEFRLGMLDSGLRWIPCADWNGADLLGATGLKDVCIADADNITSTTVQLTLKTKFGSPINPIGLKGVVVADFVSSKSNATGKVYDKTTDADVTINTVTAHASPNNDVYDIEHDSAAVGNELDFMVRKTGYDGTCMLSTPIVIPSS